MATNVTVETRWTELGLKTLIEQGITDSLVSFDIGDTFNNYAVTVGNTIPNKLGGSHLEVTANISCGEANGTQMYATPPTEQEIDEALSQIKTLFISDDCSQVFEKSGLSLRVNVDQLLARLTDSVTNYSFGMSGLGIDLWNYIAFQVEKYNPTTSDYDIVDQIYDVKLSWSPNTSEDGKNYLNVSPTLVYNIDNTKQLNVKEQRFQSPTGLNFLTANVNGFTVDATQGHFTLLPTRWVYLVNGSQVIDIKTLETSDLSLYESIIPAFYIGSTLYTYNAKGSIYPTKEGLVGYLNYFVSQDGVTATQGFYNQAYLAFKTLGTVSTVNPNVYEIPVNLTVIPSDKRINGIKNIYGNKLSIVFSFDISNTTNFNNIVEITN